MSFQMSGGKSHFYSPAEHFRLRRNFNIIALKDKFNIILVTLILGVMFLQSIS